MNPLHAMDRAAEIASMRILLRALALAAALSLSIACGSAQSDRPLSGAAGTAGALDDGGGAGNAAAGQSGSGSAGASAGNGDAKGGAVGTGGSAGVGGIVAEVGSTAAGVGGSSANGGAGASGASAGSGGVVQAPTCPAIAPASASPCERAGQVCFYEDCAGAGRTVANCQNLSSPGLSWSVQSAACGTVRCSGLPGMMTCASGQVCFVSQGGTISGMCEPSSCGTGPITCECAHASCGDCAISGNTQQGFTVTCNNCPQGGCA